MKKKLMILIMGVVFLSGCKNISQNTLVLADAGWDSIQFHNEIVGFIAVNAFGYDSWKSVTGTTPITHEAMIKGEIDVHLEEWTDNLATYYADLEENKFHEMGINFDDNMQGLYVPRYVIEGDEERGIAPMASGLKTVMDLKQYSSLFQDPEQKSKGRIYGCIPGWEIDSIMYNKYELYGLNESFVYFRPGSDAALAAAFTSAIDKGEAIVGYYWEPTWLIGQYDMVLLEDAPYVDDENFKAGRTECPPVTCTTAVSNQFYEKDPVICEELIANYRTSSSLISEALAYMRVNDASVEATAMWFLKNHDELLDQWMPSEKAEVVRKALK